MGSQQSTSAQAVAAQTSECFEPIIEQLMAVRMSASNLSKTVGEFASKSGAESTRIESHTRDAGDDLKAHIKSVTDSIEALQGINRHSRAHILTPNIRDHGRELRVLADLAKVAMAHTTDDEIGCDNFVESIRDLSTRLIHASEEIEQSLSTTSSALERIQHNLESADDILVGLTDETGSKDLGDGGEETSDASNEKILSEAERFNALIKERTSSMVACMQFPDAFRQRAEHVDAIVTLAVDADDSDTDILYALASKQCEGMANDLMQVSGDAQHSLRDMISIGIEVSSELRVAIAADDREQHLKSRKATIKKSIKFVKSAQGVTQDSLSYLEDLSQKTTDLRTTFEMLSKERDDINVSAFNASITAARLGQKAAGMTIIAEAAREAASECNANIEELMTTMTGFNKAAAKIDADGLTRSFSHTEDAIKKDEQVLSGLIDEAASIRGAARDCENATATVVHSARTAIASIAPTASAIRGIHSLAKAYNPSVAVPADVSDAANALLAQIWETYTMDSERVIHETLYGLPRKVSDPNNVNELAQDSDEAMSSLATEPEAVANDADAEDDLAAILF